MSYKNNPIFLVSCGRSGSTIISKSLSEHPEINMAVNEGPLISLLGNVFFEYKLSLINNYFLKSSRISPDKFEKSLKKLCFNLALGSGGGKKNFLKSVSIVFSNLNLFGSYKCWGIQTFPNENSALALLSLYPNSKFIYLYRNGLDVVHSMGTKGEFKKLSFEERCHFWDERVKLYRYLEHFDSAIIIRYEDFLKNNSKEFERIFNHIGVNFNSGPLNYANSNLVSSMGEFSKEVDNPQFYLLNRAKGFEKWSDNNRLSFKTICSESMCLLGYDIPF